PSSTLFPYTTLFRSGLVAPMQNDNSGNPFMSWVHRDALGVQENSQAYDPFGNLIYNVQPPNSGPPPYHPFYGATYGGASWNSFRDRKSTRLNSSHVS